MGFVIVVLRSSREARSQRSWRSAPNPTEPVEFVLPMGRVPERERSEGNHFMTSAGRLAAGTTGCAAE